MNHNALEKLSTGNLRKLEKYIKAFTEKVPQVIVQSRCGEKRQSCVKPCVTDVYEIGVENNAEIQEKASFACENIHPLKPFSLCIEILLKTADGDTLVLEAWQLQLKPSEKYWQQNYRMFADSETVFGHLMILLKSVVTVSRVIPAFKLSLRQSADTYVMLFRIYPGDPQVDHLGTCPQVNKIGEVYTPVGTISLTVTYRSKLEMSIAPQKADKENFMVKSDYFNVDLSPKFSGIQLGKKLRAPCQDSSSNHNVGAFAPCSSLPDPVFPELAFLEKPFLNLSRSTFHRNEKKQVNNMNFNTDTNLNIIEESKQMKDDDYDEKVCEKLVCSDTSDGSDYVLVDLKPSFANCPNDTDLGAFFQECQAAPSLPSLSGQVTLKDQVCDLSNQLAQFEMSMSDFDSFVDSVCQVDQKKL